MENYIKQMNESIKKLIGNALSISAWNFGMFLYMLKVVRMQKRATLKRIQLESENIHVPPFLIASITSKCNLKCKGCYSNVHNKNCKQELTTDKWDSLFKEAKDLGFAFILLAGGEPFIREDILNCASQYPEIIFPIFTNSTLINKDNSKRLRSMRNLIPVISIEGLNKETDARRGFGVFEKITKAMMLLKTEKVFFGLSLTVTKENFDLITSESFVSEYNKKGSQLFFFVEYVPVDSHSEDLVISQEQRAVLDERLNHLRKKYKALFIAFPQDENKFGGCLSSGRGFMHISCEGNLEPCPFAPYSDTNLNNLSLKEALNSKFLKAIRESSEHLAETEHGCALYHKKEWVQSLLEDKHEVRS